MGIAYAPPFFEGCTRAIKAGFNAALLLPGQLFARFPFT
jgi:hypothetical protein